MSKTIVLSEDQIWDYMMCPAHFEMARRKVVPTKSQTLKDYIDIVTKRFLANLMNGDILPVDQLKKDWDKICRRHSDFIDQRKCIAGYAAISKLYSWAEKVRLRVLDIMVPYAILVNGREGQKIDIRGEIPFIGVNQRNVVEILTIDYSEKHTNQVRTDMNLRHTLHCYAYQKQIGRDVGIHVRNLKYDEDIFSFRTIDDFKRVERTIADIGYAISKELFYPREGLGCVACNVAGACRVWH